ncbi:MFS transporter, UMF1 family [Marininema mesophilum]|uniref:MFS transporter, UMF1 family n=1 Tax=Marininema mesophilum TaxID=1048340 RepID=A0A1H2X5P0_9BACL|nr:MFS transporter [Marininema mesophilum]SDW88202.1 MFS transporter, UMF1 family [Marininema mesophilum]
MNLKAVRSWVMYDWANSAFVTTIMAAVMPIYYADVAAKNLPAEVKVAYWGYTQSLALALVFLLSPVLGAIADATGSKRPFLRFFTYMGALASALLFFVGEGDWALASILVVLGTVAFSGGNVFYDAYLTDLVPDEQRDEVSSRGYAVGYIGGGILLAINLTMITFPKVFLLPNATIATQVSFLTVGIWWFIFSLPFFRHVHDQRLTPSPSISPLTHTKQGIRSTFTTIRRLGRYPELLKYLISFWFFSDGINTIIKMATIYGREIGIGQKDLIAALLITQFVGIPCTLIIGKLSNRLGAKSTLSFTIIAYLFIVLLGFFMQSAIHFYLLAIMVGLVQGGSQALSRSIFTRLVPPQQNAEFFGLYGLSGKFASIFGPALFGLIGQLSGSSRLGIASLAIFFLVGLIMLYLVDIDKGKLEANSSFTTLIKQAAK